MSSNIKLIGQEYQYPKSTCLHNGDSEPIKIGSYMYHIIHSGLLVEH
jgi:hypothetical protein